MGNSPIDDWGDPDGLFWTMVRWGMWGVIFVMVVVPLFIFLPYLLWRDTPEFFYFCSSGLVLGMFAGFVAWVVKRIPKPKRRIEHR